MKKQFQILATTFISIAIVSCSKQGVQMPEAQKTTKEEISTSSSVSSLRTVPDPLTVNLDGWYTFNGNLKDVTKQLPDGVPTSRGVIYTYDRHGIYHDAIKFDGSYGLKLFKVPQQTHASVAAWVSCANLNYGTGRMIFRPKSGGDGIGLSKTGAEINGSVQSPNFGSLGVSAGTVNNGWHHFVVTFDDVYIRIYKDGVLANSILCGASYPLTLEDYFVGYYPYPAEWFEGSVDDLRFYSRTLSATDIQKLYNL
jgi:hypothetical protein